MSALTMSKKQKPIKVCTEETKTQSLEEKLRKLLVYKRLYHKRAEAKIKHDLALFKQFNINSIDIFYLDIPETLTQYPNLFKQYGLLTFHNYSEFNKLTVLEIETGFVIGTVNFLRGLKDRLRLLRESTETFNTYDEAKQALESSNWTQWVLLHNYEESIIDTENYDWSLLRR